MMPAKKGLSERDICTRFITLPPLAKQNRIAAKGGKLMCWFD
jgi:hypothetical protein